MRLEDLKKDLIREELKIDSSYGRILSVIDFGNVNHWFETDRQDSDNRPLSNDEKFVIDLKELKNFTCILSEDTRFYYGMDSAKAGSVNFIVWAKEYFGRHKAFTKEIQYVRHHLKDGELSMNTRDVLNDKDGTFIRIPKANFDVEIAVDTIRLVNSYDTLVLFSGDADFVALNRYLGSKGKKVILIKAGNITSDLRKSVNLVINAQRIKSHIAKTQAISKISK